MSRPLVICSILAEMSDNNFQQRFLNDEKSQNQLPIKHPVAFDSSNNASV
tara:strand:- start:59 stop:208 length:150 start_codon:yes stop_codon:yes gene_type:complete